MRLGCDEDGFVNLICEAKLIKHVRVSHRADGDNCIGSEHSIANLLDDDPSLKDVVGSPIRAL
ncbi:MAG TPA: hypothetical protein VIP09_13665 [Dehalococcoidia bacterium]